MICPEPYLKNGTRVTADVCTKIITSEGKPGCHSMPFFANVSLLPYHLPPKKPSGEFIFRG